MTEVLFGVLLQGLKLWNTKEASKYRDEVYELQKSWLEEYNKPRASRSNANLDDIEQRLHILGKIFIDSAGKPNA
jgi:hypothetical protein